MSAIDQLASLYAYHFDTTYRLIALAENLSATATHEPSRHSIRDLFFHILGTDRSWRIGLATGRRPERLPRQAYPDLVALKRGFEQEHAAWSEFLAGLDEAQIGEVIELRAGPDRVFCFGRWQVLHHVLLHGMQHHAEIAAELTGQGLSPGNIDFIFYAP